MNRVFKRLPKGEFSQSEIKFTFEGKSYPACKGDTIEAALLANNILTAGRTKLGNYACSAGNLYQGVVDILDQDYRFTVVSRDFLISNGQKLGQTNKRKIKDQLVSALHFLKAHRFIPEALNPISEHDITKAIIRADDTKDLGKKMIDNMRISVEKSYIHTDIVIMGVNNDALNAAYILAEAGCYVVLCDDGQEDAYFITQDPELFSAVKTHKLIKIKKLSDIRICTKTKQVIATQRSYIYDDKKETESILKLYVINARKIIMAPSLQETGFLFAGHHLPAVMGVREYIGLHQRFDLVAQQNIVLHVSNDRAYDILSLPHISKHSIEAIVDTRSKMTEAMFKAEKSGFKLYAGYIVTQAHGKNAVENITIQSVNAASQEEPVKSLKSDLLLHSAGYVYDLVALGDQIKVKEDMSIVPDIQSEDIFVVDEKHNIYTICKEILTSLGQKPQLPKDLSTDYTQPENNVTVVHDLYPKDYLFFPQDIPFGDFIQIVHQYDDPLEIIKITQQYANFYNNHWAIRILLHQVQQIYNYTPEKISELYKDILKLIEQKSGPPSIDMLLRKIPVCGNPKPHILLDGKTADCDLSSQKLHEYYHKIKSHAGVRMLDKRVIMDLSGLEVSVFLNELALIAKLDKDFSEMPLGDKVLIAEKNCHHPTIIMRLQEHKFCLLADADSFIVHSASLLYQENRFKAVVNYIHQNWALVQMVGAEVTNIFQEITKISASMFCGKAGHLWLENIQLIFVHYEQYNMTHIDVLIASDAANSFYHKLVQSNYNIHPFDAPIYDMIILEAGHIFDMPKISKSKADQAQDFSTQALAVPLVKSDIPLCVGHIFPDKPHAGQEPQGVLLATKIFSPYYNQYILPVLLKGQFEEWDNKTVMITSEDKTSSMQVKIISDKMLKIDEVA